MPAFSYTAPTFDKSDEEREKADLSAEEKELILDDMYGRNLPDVNVTANNGNNNVTTPTPAAAAAAHLANVLPPVAAPHTDTASPPVTAQAEASAATTTTTTAVRGASRAASNPNDGDADNFHNDDGGDNDDDEEESNNIENEMRNIEVHEQQAMEEEIEEQRQQAQAVQQQQQQQQQPAGDNQEDNDEFADITTELLNEYYLEIDKIPLENKVDYLEALAMCNSVENNRIFENECNPKYFLHYCDNNAEEAAARMIRYWKMRKLIFGTEKAFLPMTLSGALNDDIDEWSNSIRNICLVLPNDSKGRTVVCYDRTLITKLHHLSPNIIVRIAWYTGHYILKRRSARENGVVLLFVMKLTSLNHFYRIFAKLIIQTCKDCLPLKAAAIHFFPSDVTFRFILPTIKFLLNPFLRTRMKTHKPELTGSELIRDLQPYGLRRDRLPKKIGGTYVANLNWIHEQLLKEQEQQDQE